MKTLEEPVMALPRATGILAHHRPHPEGTGYTGGAPHRGSTETMVGETHGHPRHTRSGEGDEEAPGGSP